MGSDAILKNLKLLIFFIRRISKSKGKYDIVFFNLNLITNLVFSLIQRYSELSYSNYKLSEIHTHENHNQNLMIRIIGDQHLILE